MQGTVTADAVGLISSGEPGDESSGQGQPTWRGLPLIAQLYVGAVIAAGAGALIVFFPRAYPHPVLFAVLVLCACLTSAWKVTLPIPVANGSTLSVSYAASLISLLLLDGRYAVIIAIVGAWTQCTYRAKQPYPVHRTIFSIAMA